MQDFVQTLQQPNTDSTIKLHGVTNNSQLLANEANDPVLTRNIQVGTDTVEINSTPMNPTQTSDVDNSSELKGVTTNDDIPLATHQETDTAEINGVMMTSTQNTPEQN